LFAKGELTDGRPARAFPLASRTATSVSAHAIAADFSAKEKVTSQQVAAFDKDAQRALAKERFAWTSPAGQDLALYALERRSAARRGSRVPGVDQVARPPSCGSARVRQRARRVYGARQLLPGGQRVVIATWARRR
jgi:hypothetical protein